MKNHKDLAEYLFLDKPRIERYFQQLSAPVKYDKLPVWKVALGITGPSVEGAQSRPGREFSFDEKLQKVLSHMQSEELLSKTRPTLDNSMLRPDGSGGYDLLYQDGRNKPFVTETLSARRARIEREGQILNIWVSLSPDKPDDDDDYCQTGALYLIEDFRGEDQYPQMESSWSSLWLLVSELHSLKNTPLDPIALLKEMDGVIEERFASDPIGSLKSIGANFGPLRHIDTIYRTRASCGERRDDHCLMTTIGYPLVIREA